MLLTPPPPLLRPTRTVNNKIPAWSDIALPYPFVRDDVNETFRRAKTPASRMMPSREQTLEANAVGCGGFEITLDVAPFRGTLFMLVSRVEELRELDPFSSIPTNDRDGGREGGDVEEEQQRGNSMMHLLRGAARPTTKPVTIQDQALS